jgi:hypothetical protein
MSKEQITKEMRRKKLLKWLLIFSGLLLVLLLVNNKQIHSRIMGGLEYQDVQISPGNMDVPHERTIEWKSHSVFADSICNEWARKLIPGNLDGKGNYPRIILAKLQIKRDIPEVNKTIMKMKVWGVSGSSWALNKKGDYDFTFTILTTILFQYGDNPELLYPETKDYLLHVLISEEGNKFRYTAPRTLGLVKETENHILMTEGSRYLKNRWIMLHGNKEAYYDNVQNGMEQKLLDFLEEMRTKGLYEFNSIPYIGYTITALLNLEAFASEKLRAKAREVLDYMNWTYALGSYQLKHYPPMRRRYEKASIQELTTDYQSIFIKTWLSYAQVPVFNTDISHGEVHALMAACMPYRPADQVVEMIFSKGDGYFVRLGHGPGSSPEIFSAGKHFLLSAGGVNRGKASIIVARPITLFLNDPAATLPETFHLAGPGTDFMQWNNTGVYRNFACAAGPVKIPKGVSPVAEKDGWSVYSLKDSISIAAYSTDKLGLMAVFAGIQPAYVLENILGSNPAPEILNNTFQFPGGSKIEYDVNASSNLWVIKSVDGNPVDRNFDQWPLIEGDLRIP